jgi:esterase/lipase superfamily enzyme
MAKRKNQTAKQASAFLLKCLLLTSLAFSKGSTCLAENVDLYYATTRLNESPSGRPLYGGKRHLDLGQGSTEYGITTFPKPDNAPPLSRAANWSTLRQQMNLRDLTWITMKPGQINKMSESDFYRQLRDFHGQILIYAHGYDQTFDEASREFAELIDEITRREPDKKLLPILYTWPSPGNTADYPGDEANLEWTEKPFRELLNRISLEKTADSSLNLLAHSMGARLAFWYGTIQGNYGSAPLFNNIYLTNADLDFHTAEQKKPELERLVAGNLYVFTNDNDGPLLTSQLLHKEPRLGRPAESNGKARQDIAQLAANPKQAASELLTNFINEGQKLNTNSNLTQFALKASEKFLPKQSSNTNHAGSPEVQKWLNQNPSLSRPWGSRSKLIDVTGLVTLNLGHRLPWPVLASLIATGNFSPFVTNPSHKKPDSTTLSQMGGQPLYLYRWEKLDTSILSR